jgi:hypothetical protein
MFIICFYGIALQISNLNKQPSIMKCTALQNLSFMASYIFFLQFVRQNGLKIWYFIQKYEHLCPIYFYLFQVNGV